MKKKVAGRKGRPRIGKQRTFSCSDEQYAMIKAAAKLAGQKAAEFVRAVAVEKAKQITGSESDE